MVFAILVKRPLHDVAVHIMQSPGVGFFEACFFISIAAVAFVPGIFVQLFGVVAERVGRAAARAAGIFPLGFGGQAVENARFVVEPLAKMNGRVLRHVDGGIALSAHTKRHIDVGRTGARAGIGFGQAVLGVGVAFGHFFFDVFGRKQVVEIPNYLVFAHPKRFNFHLVLRPFVGLAVFFLRGASHQKFAALNGHQVINHNRSRNFLGIIFKFFLRESGAVA